MTTASVWLYPETTSQLPTPAALERGAWEYGYAADPDTLELMAYCATHDRRTGALKGHLVGTRVPSYDDLYLAWIRGLEAGHYGSPGNPYGHPAEAVCWRHGYLTATGRTKAEEVVSWADEVAS